MRHAVMMRGRMVHFEDGNQQLQRYGRDDSEVIWSIHRGRLNADLLNAAEAEGVRIEFDQRIAGVDWRQRQLHLEHESSGSSIRAFSTLIGADGAGSAVRVAMSRVCDLGERFEPLGHGYKELEIPPAADGGFRIERNALHIWPRGSYMCIALPNSEGTFTVTLFLPNQGAYPSFASLKSGDDAERLFDDYFQDARALMPSLKTDFIDNPLGELGTLRLQRWHLDDRAVLLGDAAHAMVPFHGQGMNCAFEDCVALADAMAGHSSLADAFAAFEAERRMNASAIQDMALENYIEMRDRVDDADYLLQRELELHLAERHPDRFVPRYSMITFGRTPYIVAQRRGEQQRQLLIDATRGASTLGEVDIELVSKRVLAELPPLSVAVSGGTAG